MRSNRKLGTTLFRKETNNDIYPLWETFDPITWKKDTLRTLTRCVYTICSNDNLLQEEFLRIEACFTETSGYQQQRYEYK